MLVQQIMGLLIQNAWIEGEAKRQGVSVSPAQVQRQLAQIKQKSFPKAKDYQRFLTESGMTEAEVLSRVRLQVLSERLQTKFRENAQNGIAAISQQQVTSLYDKHKRQYWTPESRDTDFIVASSKASAMKAIAAVKAGMSWPRAAARYSTAPGTPELTELLRPGHEHRFDIVFSAKPGEIVGPSHDQFGWSVFRVRAIRAAGERPFSAVQSEIRTQLAERREAKVSSALRKQISSDFQKRWKALTHCRAGYVVSLCANAPKAKTAAGSQAG
jgi:foldase protein PrsA